MADPELLAILRRGPEAWNRYRDEGSDGETPDLSRADLSGLDLREADLHGANLTWGQSRRGEARRRGSDRWAARSGRGPSRQFRRRHAPPCADDRRSALTRDAQRCRSHRGRSDPREPRLRAVAPRQSLRGPAPDGERFPGDSRWSPASGGQPEGGGLLGCQSRRREASGSEPRRCTATDGELAQRRLDPLRGNWGSLAASDSLRRESHRGEPGWSRADGR